MYLTPKKKQNSPYPRVDDYADSPGAQGWGRDDRTRRSRVLTVLASHYRRFGVSAAHKYRARNHPDITEDELEDFVDEELSSRGSGMSAYINKSSGRILARSLYGEGRNPIDERQRASDVSVVAGAASIERHGLGDGEPIEIRGTVSLPKKDEAEAVELKNYDTSFQIFPTGHWNDQMTLMNQIPSGPFNGQRIGSSVKLLGFEARMRIFNTIGNSGTTVQPSYSWAGQVGIVGTTRTVPAIQMPANAWTTTFTDTLGAPACSGCNVVSTVSGNLASVKAGLITDIANLNTGVGPSGAITMKAAEVNIVDQQSFPAFPGWTSPALTMYNSYKNGKVTSFRVMVLYDKFGNDAKNASGSAGPPSWNDLMELNGPNTAPSNSLYSIPALERFLVMYDGLHEPDIVSDLLAVVIPPKCIDLEAVYQITSGAQPYPIASGCIYLAVAPLDLWLLTDPAPYVVEGVFRVFYKDG